MLASTVQFSKNNQTPLPIRISPACPRRSRWFKSRSGPITERHSRVLSGPNSVPISCPSPRQPLPRRQARSTNTVDNKVLSQPGSTNEPHPAIVRRRRGSGRPPKWRHCEMLLRKEVIQPHLPVRLPCYDFVPIASPTFDRSPHYWLGHGLRVLPTFVT